MVLLNYFVRNLQQVGSFSLCRETPFFFLRVFNINAFLWKTYCDLEVNAMKKAPRVISAPCCDGGEMK